MSMWTIKKLEDSPKARVEAKVVSTHLVKAFALMHRVAFITLRRQQAGFQSFFPFFHHYSRGSRAFSQLLMLHTKFNYDAPLLTPKTIFFSRPALFSLTNLKHVVVAFTLRCHIQVDDDAELQQALLGTSHGYFSYSVCMH